MPAPSLASLHDFEGQFATAAKAILVSAGFAPVRAAGEPGTVPDEVIVTNFLTGPAVSGVRGALTPQGYVIPSIYDGELEIMVRRRRDDNVATEIPGISRRLNEAVATIRGLLLEQPEPFTPANLPYYDVSQILPAACDYAYNRETRLEAVVLSWNVRWCLNPDELPADA